MALIGNKIDLEERVNREDALALAQSYSIEKAFFVSALTGEGLDEMF